MNFLNIEYFLAITRAGTIRRASEALFITPQTLSEHLAKLEKELGTQLVYRTSPLSLTEAGERFLRFAETCAEEKRLLERDLSGIIERDRAGLRLGVPAGMTPPLLLRFLESFRQEHPEITVTVTELPTRTGAVKTLPENIDAVFTELTDRSAPAFWDPVFSSTDFVVAIHRKLLAAVYGEKASGVEAGLRAGRVMELWEFRDCPFVLKRAGSLIREKEDRIFRAAGFSPRSVMETGDVEMAVHTALMGEGAVFFPAPVAKVGFRRTEGETSGDPALLLCPVKAEGERWALGLYRGRSCRAPESLAALLESAKSYYRAQLGPAD